MNKKRWKREMEVKNYQINFSYVEQLKHFLQCVKQRKKTINDLEQGIVTLKIALAIKKSSKLMKTVNV
jgi:predicted dehydrogenase